jgi:hypothetical protein
LNEKRTFTGPARPTPYPKQAQSFVVLGALLESRVTLEKRLTIGSPRLPVEPPVKVCLMN